MELCRVFIGSVCGFYRFVVSDAESRHITILTLHCRGSKDFILNIYRAFPGRPCLKSNSMIEIRAWIQLGSSYFLAPG